MQTILLRTLAAGVTVRPQFRAELQATFDNLLFLQAGGVQVTAPINRTYTDADVILGVTNIGTTSPFGFEQTALSPVEDLGTVPLLDQDGAGVTLSKVYHVSVVLKKGAVACSFRGNFRHDVYGTGVLTSTAANLADGDIIGIGGRNRRAKNTLAAIDDFKIGANRAATFASFTHMINGTGVAGTDWFTGTTSDANVTAGALTGDTLTVTAKTVGETPNAVTLSKTAASLTWGASTLLGGTDHYLTIPRATGDRYQYADFGADGLTLAAGGVLHTEVETLIGSDAVAAILLIGKKSS